MTEDDDLSLYHYGKKGMKWGVRNRRERSRQKAADKVNRFQGDHKRLKATGVSLAKGMGINLANMIITNAGQAIVKSTFGEDEAALINQGISAASGLANIGAGIYTISEIASIARVKDDQIRR